MEKMNIVDNPKMYGNKGETWAPEFVEYMKAIVTHPAYYGMPDAVKNDGKIQWEAPSNRASGIYQHTHTKRKTWWKNKAESIGIDTTQDKWISQTAKMIHPTGEKPCKRCGKIMRIGYVYPQDRLIKKILKFYSKCESFSGDETIFDILEKIHDIYGDGIFSFLGHILETQKISVPNFNGNFEELITWVEDIYVPSEPSLLSPGAMSNAPDRFDGFHSFNRCCRGKADSGRHLSNLRSYSTDRRVFEFWSDGDWIAADRLMGLVKSKLRDEPNADGGSGPPTADHIGPLSLGFSHRPEFKLLSKAANSAKNNRMSFSDVNYLILSERKGDSIISWHSKPLWDLCKHHVDNNEKALRLSKLLRDNQRDTMRILSIFLERKKYSFLVYLLDLKYADNKIDFINLRSEDFITKYDDIKIEPRLTKYASEQKSRRIRIGLEALRSYKEKVNRHNFPLDQNIVTTYTDKALEILNWQDEELNRLDHRLNEILLPPDGIIKEEDLRKFAMDYPTVSIQIFEQVKEIIYNAKKLLALDMFKLWDSDRYVREDMN